MFREKEEYLNKSLNARISGAMKKRLATLEGTKKKNESSTGPMKVLLEKLYHFMGFIELQAQMAFLGISVATLQP